MAPLNWKLRRTSDPFLARCTTGWDDCSKLQRKIELLLHKEDREDYVWNPWDSLRSLLVLLCTIMKLNGKIQQ